MTSKKKKALIFNTEIRNKAGYQSKGKPAFVAIGKFRRPHGVRGEVVMDNISINTERIVKGTVLFVGEQHQEVTVHSARKTHNGMLISLEGYLDRDLAGEFRNQLVHFRTEDLPELPDGGFYLYELIGMRVSTDNSEFLGRIHEVMETGANDVYVVKKQSDSTELLLPAIESVILDINFDTEEVTVKLPEWL
ncbi:MAG: 16S rRNA processing protein RimM [Anaerolineaceae bacterium]|nr:16S rRNA processing protein RimM [Anaerolineaceae bacterium]